MAKNTLKAYQINAGKGFEQKAINLAFETDKDPAFDATIEEQMVAKEVTDTGAATLLLKLRDKFELSDFPVPGSKIEDMPEGFNGLVDQFKVKKRNDNGNETNVSQSFFVLFADNTSKGRSIKQELAWLNELGKQTPNLTGISAEFQREYAGNAIARGEQKAYLEGRRKTLRAAYRKAVALWFKMEAINEMGSDENGGDVKCHFIYSDPKTKTKIKQTAAPIRVSCASDPLSSSKDLTVNTFLRLDVDHAIEQGRTFEALMKTLQRDNGGDNGGNSRPQAIRTIDTFEAKFVDIDSAIKATLPGGDNTDLRNKIFAKILGKDGDDLLLSMYDVSNIIGEWLSSSVVEAKLDTLLERRAAAEKASKEAKAA